MTTPPVPPFEDSRRLTGPNLHFAATGATLDALRRLTPDERDAWRERATQACAFLDWPPPTLVARAHASGETLSFSAPVDQLFAATEVNEWALCCALAQSAFHAPGWPSITDAVAARETLQRMAIAERQPDLRGLLSAAAGRGVPALLDDDALSLGAGEHGRTWPLDRLPAIEAIDWPSLRRIPVALVSGSNGKTTTVRLIAAMLAAEQLTVGYSCTDGVQVDGEAIGSGDYSGPAGARHVLRHPRTQAAVLETARGGILRRGLAVQRADVAVVTNVSADHFGEYGIDDLGALCEVKLTLARALDRDGVLVANADDVELSQRAPGRAARLAWFAANDEHPLLVTHRARGGSTCAVADGVLILTKGSVRSTLGDVASMPLCAAGSARYNIANAAAAALAADALGVAHATIRAVLATFGSQPQHNPGRLERYRFGGIEVLVDYAHNPAGLDGLLGVAQSLRAGGRLALLLGQAGNRRDTDLHSLARTAARHDPALIVLKGIDGYQRGRGEDEVALLLRDGLIELGFPAARLAFARREIEAVRAALRWSRAGDVLALPVHALPARAACHRLLSSLIDSGWQAGEPLPA